MNRNLLTWGGGFLVLLSLLFSLNRFFKNKRLNEIHWRDLGGQELILRRNGLEKLNPHMSLRSLLLDHKSEMTKLKEGKLVYRAVYTVDKKGFRISKATNLPGKTKHFLIIDGSIAFGEGLNDDETIHHLINMRSKIYEAYELGFLGYGPQHNWLRFNSKQLGFDIHQKRGSAILITHAQDFRRLIGTLDHLTYSSNFPLLVESSPGKFEHRGNFINNGTLLQRLAARFCVPFLFCKKFMVKSFKDPDENQVAFAARLYDSIEKMYREQFDVEDFKIVWVGEEDVAIFKKFSKIKIIKIPFDRIDSSHPSAQGAKEIVDFLFSQKIIY